VTPDELHALADAATENWRVEPGQSQYLFVGGLHRFRTLMRSDADARLAALAPDLARLCAEQDEAFRTILDLVTGWSRPMPDDDRADLIGKVATAALTKLAELETR